MISHRENSFRAVTEVIPQDLAVRYAENANHGLRGRYGCNGWVLGWRLTQTSTIDARFGTPLPRRATFGLALPLLVNHICFRVIRVIRGQILFLLFLAELLESGTEGRKSYSMDLGL